MRRADRAPSSPKMPQWSRRPHILNGVGERSDAFLAFGVQPTMPHHPEDALQRSRQFRRQSPNMNMTLDQLLDEHGDAAFPHAPDTVEALLQLFRMGRDGGAVAVDCVVSLVRSDPGFAFNIARLLHEDGMSLGTGAAVDLRAYLEKFNVFRAVAILAPKERHADVFGSNHRLGAAYRRVSAAAVKAASDVAAASRIVDDFRDVAVFMALRSAFGLLGIANVVPDKAPSILKTGADADRACEEILGFSVAQFAAALNERYRLPEVTNALYPSVVRDTVREACVNIFAAAASPRRQAIARRS